jgi:hypothetical protein
MATPVDGWAVACSVTADPNGDAVDWSAFLHWDGHSWSLVPAAPPSSFRAFSHIDFNYLFDVAAIGPQRAVAVGTVSRSFQFGNENLIEEWNRESWIRLASPQPPPVLPSGQGYLGDVSMIRRELWSVGAYKG